jgi:hypothetical protein
VEDFAAQIAAQIQAHTCSTGLCHKWTHEEIVLISPEDVADFAAELRTLIAVRDGLIAHGYQLLEGEPTPRFEAHEPGEPKPWTVKFEQVLAAQRDAATGTGVAPLRSLARRGWLRRLWTPEA